MYVFSYAFELKICTLKDSKKNLALAQQRESKKDKKKIETTRVFDLQPIITMKTHLSIQED